MRDLIKSIEAYDGNMRLDLNIKAYSRFFINFNEKLLNPFKNVGSQKNFIFKSAQTNALLQLSQKAISLGRITLLANILKI